MPPRAPFTHFLAIPLYTPRSAGRLTASLSRFAADVTVEPSTSTGSNSPALTLSSPTTDRILAEALDGLLLTEPSDNDTASIASRESTANNNTNNNSTSSSSRNDGQRGPRTTILRPPLPRESLRPVSSLHLTLGVMSITDPAQLEEAAAFLKTLDLSAMLEVAATAAATVAAASNVKGKDKYRPLSKQMPMTTTTASAVSASTQEPSIIVDATDATVSMPIYNNNNSNLETPELNSAREQEQPLVVRLQGLVPMQDLYATSVLYAAPLDDSGRLQWFCEALNRTFVEAGFVMAENRPLKLHASLVNTLHIRRGGGGGGGARGGGRGGRETYQGGSSRRQRLKIDANEIVQRWKEEVWAEIEVEKVVIYEMGVKPGADGLPRYREVAELAMPYGKKVHT